MHLTKTTKSRTTFSRQSACSNLVVQKMLNPDFCFGQAVDLCEESLPQNRVDLFNMFA